MSDDNDDIERIIRNEPEPPDTDPATDWSALRAENARRVRAAMASGKCRVGRPIDLTPHDCRGPVRMREPLQHRIRLAVRDVVQELLR